MLIQSKPMTFLKQHFR